MWWSPNRLQFSEMGKFCLHPDKQRFTDDLDGCAFHSDPLATENNVPQHTDEGTIMEKQPQTIDEPVHILIVTHAKDLPWLQYALKAIDRHLAGFSGVTVAHPEDQYDAFKAATERHQVLLHPYPETVGKGMLLHMAKMAEADLIVPHGTGHVLHMDSDCIFHTSSTPEDFFTDGRPDYLFRPYESLISVDPRNPRNKVISDCYQWKNHTERQLGFKCDAYTMTRHPTVFPASFYAPYRKHLTAIHRMPYRDWFLTGRNQHPQDRMDFTAMGAWAKRYMPEKFHWIDVSAGPYPKDRLRAYWSHGGITPEIRREIEGFLR